MKKNIFLLNKLFTYIFLALFLTLNCCVKTVKNKGFNLDETKLSYLQSGKSTKDQVYDVLGSPSSKSNFGRETWYYITAKEEQLAFLNPKTLDQQVIAVEFSPNGVVTELKRFNMKDANNIAFSKDKTISPGDENNVLKEMIGNVGRFNKDPKDMRKK